jgi:integrase
VSSSKITKRRDALPARAYADGRVAYWTGGKPGQGKRKQKRLPGFAEAERWAAVYNLSATGGADSGTPKPLRNLDEMFQDFLDQLRRNGEPEGTIRQYKSNWNVWVPAEIGSIPCGLAELQHFTAIFNGLTGKQSTRLGTVRSIARTIGAAITFGVQNGYFAADAAPFGSPDHRKAVVKKAVETVRKRAEVEHRYDNDSCPTAEDVDLLAAAVEKEYPGYGRRLVLLGFATGMRINELLALQWDSIDLVTGLVCVDWQMDRYQPWPARRLPKGGKRRETRLWQGYLHVAESLILDALERPDGNDAGWLFPRRNTRVKWWSDSVGVFLRKAITAASWDWTFHWLRHGFASWNLTPRKDGGFGLAVKVVQGWLGHSKPSITQDMYLESHRGGDEEAWRETGRPGRKAS